MWNYNNGQILRKMRKESCSETSDVLFLGIVYSTNQASHRYIAAVGWDRKITLFYDNPDEFEVLASNPV
jgi:hypothetical protein